MHNLPAVQDPIRVVAQPHPFRSELLESQAPVGYSIEDIVGKPAYEGIEVFIDGEHVDHIEWEVTRPKSGSLVNIKVIPRGDILKVIFTIVIVIAAVVLAPVIAGAIFPGAGAGFLGVATTLIQVGLTIGGFLLINALIPPQLPKLRETDTFERLAAITGVRNQIAAFRPIPRLLGTVKYFPPIPMTAPPHTELVGDDQYLRAMFVLGYGKIDIGGLTVGVGSLKKFPADAALGTNIFIGDTQIDQFDDVEMEVGDPDDITLYTTQIIELVVNLPVDSVTEIAPGKVVESISNIRTTETDTEEVSLDIEFPSGLYSLADDGSTRVSEVTFDVEYRLAGSGDPWVNVNPADEIFWFEEWENDEESNFVVSNPTNTWTIRSSAKKTIRRSIRWKVTKAQYDVRLTRKETYNAGNNIASTKAIWTVLRSMRPNKTAFDMDNVVVLAVRIKATDELSGPLDTLSVKATSIINVWNGSTWSEQASNNPAWCFVDALSGIASKRPVDKDNDIDKAALLSWANWTSTNGFEFNHVYDSSGTVFDRVKEIAAAGRAAWAVRDNLITVVREETDQVPQQVFTPRNSSGFKLSKSFPEFPHALRVRFVDPVTYEDTERLVFDDGFNEGNATKFDILDLRGVTSPSQAWKLGRFHLAQFKLRPETYTLNIGLESLITQRGSAVSIQHDVMLVGLGQGRIKSVVLNGSNEVIQFESDEELFMEAAKTYGIKVRYIDGSDVLTIAETEIQTVSPSTNTVVIITPLPQEVVVGDLFAFGEIGKEKIDAKIIEIIPKADLTAQLRLAPLAPGLLTADSGTIPPFNPVITDPIDFTKLPPPVPVINRLRSDETVLIRDADGSLKSQLVVYFTFPPGRDKTDVELRYTQTDTPQSWERIKVPSDSGVISISNVADGISYDLELRAIRGEIASPWSTTTTHIVVGKSSPPSDVTGFTVNIEEFGLRLSWNEIPDIDRGTYEIRKGTTWSSATFICRCFTTEASVDVATTGVHDYLIKALDTSGNYSVTAASASITVVASGPASPMASFIGPNLRLDWTATKGTFPILDFEIRRGGTSYATATFVARTKATSFQTPVDWSASEKWWVQTIDAAGNGNTATSIDAIVVASAVTSVNPQVIDNTVLLKWSSTPGTVPIDRYEIRKGNVFATADIVGTSDTTFTTILEIQGGTFTYWIVPIDTAGNSGTSGNVTADVNEPPDFALRGAFRSDGLGTRASILRDSNDRKSLDFTYNQDHYVNVPKASIDAKTDVTIEFAASFDGDPVSEHTVMSSYEGTDNTTLKKFDIQFLPTATDGTIDIKVRPFGQTAALLWTITDSLYDGKFRFYSVLRDQTSGDVELFINGVSQGVKTATLTTLDIATNMFVLGTNLSSGAGTEGDHILSQTMDGRIDEFRIWDDIRTPTEVSDNWDKELDLTETNLRLYFRFNVSGNGLTADDLTGNDFDANIFGATFHIIDPSLIASFHLTETFGDKDTVHGYTTLQAQIDAGFAYYAQPVPTTSDITEVYNVGTVLAQSRILVNITLADIVSGITSSIQISTKKLLGDSWTDFTAGLSDVFATDFQYVKVKVSFSGTNKQFAILTALDTTLGTKRKTDEGTITVDVNPKTVTFNTTFVDIDSIIVTVDSITPVIHVIEFTDAPNPTDFKVRLFDDAGVAVTGKTIHWIARGV